MRAIYVPLLCIAWSLISILEVLLLSISMRRADVEAFTIDSPLSSQQSDNESSNFEIIHEWNGLNNDNIFNILNIRKGLSIEIRYTVIG